MFETQSSVGTSTGSNGNGTAAKTDEPSSPTSKNALMKLKSYLIALRVWSLSASIIPTILGKPSSSGRAQQVADGHRKLSNSAPKDSQSTFGDAETGSVNETMVSCDFVDLLTS